MAALRVWRAGPALAAGASRFLAAVGECRGTVTKLRDTLRVFTVLLGQRESAQEIKQSSRCLKIFWVEQGNVRAFQHCWF